MSALPNTPQPSPEERYLELERTSDTKHEFINGEVVAMTGASEKHNTIVLNVGSTFHGQFRNRPCRAYANDMRVHAAATGQYFYPDVIALCGEPELGAHQFDTLLNPNGLVEVLSPSTEAYDRSAKLLAYTQIPSVHDYLLIAQDEPRLEHYTRSGNQWLLTVVRDLDATLQLAAIGCALTLADVYDKVTFEEE